MSGPRDRTVVLGFDALSLDYLDEFDLPHFAALRAEGVETALESTFPPWTASAWPSMYTGRDPSHHGVYDFFAFDGGYPDEVDVVTRNDVDAPAIWNYLSARDVPSIVLNLPITYPAEPMSGVLVPGYLAPEAADGYPSGIRDELAEALGEYHIYSRAERGDLDDYRVADFVDLIEHRGRAARYLLETKPWRLAILQVQKTDAVFHKFDDRSAFARVYAAADAFLGTVLESVDERTNVIVCSDHGIGPTTGYRIYLNQVLEEAGYLRSTSGRAGLPRLGREKQRLTDHPDGTEDGHRLSAWTIQLSRAVLDRTGVSVGTASRVADRLGLLPFITRHLSTELRASLERGVDWSASRAYCRSGNELGVRINLAGREPAGVVTDAEYEAVRDEVIDLLGGLETPDGNPAFEAVLRREAVYRGPHADAACDVLVLPTGMANTIATNLLGARFVPIDTHDHKRHGTFIGAGPGFDTAADRPTLSLTDVAPMAMALAGCPVPERLGWTPPDSLLTVPVTTADYGTVPFGTGAGRGDPDERIAGRLRDLGYL